MKRQIFALVCGAAFLGMAGCAEQTVSAVSPGTFTGMRSSSVYVPVFDAKPGMASETTGLFIAELSARTNVTVVRGNSIAHDENPDVTNASMLPDTDTGMNAARQMGAGMMVVGEVTTRRTGTGYAGVVVLQVMTLADGATVTRLREEATGTDERQAALNAVKLAAAAMAAGF